MKRCPFPHPSPHRLLQSSVAQLPPPTKDPYGAFRSAGYRWYSAGNFVSVLGRQMIALAVGYEVFQRTNSAMALGLIGLAGALPVIFLALPAGQVADRFSRRGIIIVSQAVGLLTSLLLAGLTAFAAELPHHPWLTYLSGGLYALAERFGEAGKVTFGPEIPLIFLALLLSGTARTFGWAARSPYIINLVSRQQYANAITWNSSLFEIGCITGPALGGVLLGWADVGWMRALLGGWLQPGWEVPLVCMLDAACSLLFILCLLPSQHEAPLRKAAPGHPLQELFSGMRFVWQTKVILATITLDLFAVLLGGATALLPIFAERILGTGAIGLGWLRGAQSVGAITMAISLAHLPPMRRAGRTLLWAVAAFGGAMIVFGLSRNFWLSLAALAIAGAADNVSVVVRHTLVQLLTPDHMRGRVAAVNNIFIGSSNELGAFESGITAALFGPVLSVVGGGIGTLLSVAGVAWKWPAIRRIGALEAPPEDQPPANELPTPPA